MKAYKGFDKNMRCRGFQFKEGEQYELPEGQEAKLCENGFHACEAPLDCFDYYSPGNSVYHEVELDATDEKGDDSKRVGKRIKIGARIDINHIIQAQYEFVRKRCTNYQQCGHRSALSGGYMSALSGGDMSALSGGYMSALSGGYRSALSGGDRSALSGGYRSALSGGNRSALSCGNRSALSGGNMSALSGGDRSALSCGNMSALSGGNMSALSGGDMSALSGGCWSVLRGGIGCKFRSGIGSVFAVEVWENGEFKGIETKAVDGKAILPNTWYKFDGKKWVEVAEPPKEDEHGLV